MFPGVTSGGIALALDPQTSGGLLFTVSADKRALLVGAFEDSGLACWEIGRIIEGADPRLIR